MFTNQHGIQFTIARFEDERRTIFVQRDQQYDCFVVNRNERLLESDAESLATTLAGKQFEWIEVFGYGAEDLHDRIDMSAVASGRQTAIGDGDPMTSWDEDPMTMSELASYILTGGQGMCDRKIVFVIGGEEDVRQLHEAISSAQADERNGR